MQLFKTDCRSVSNVIYIQKQLPLYMKHFLIRFAVLCTWIYSVVIAQDTYRFSGTVQDREAELLPYASISLNNASYGTITDESGRFELKLPAGDYTARVSYLGYRPQTYRFSLEGPLERDFILEIEDLTLEDVIITSDGRDPAYAIMQKAIDNKDQNEHPFEGYQYNAYTKSAFKFREGFDPDSLMNLGPFGRREPKEEEESEEAPAELQSEFLYLSENMSEVFVKPPNKVKENIVKSKVSGDSDQFSILGNLFNRFNPYQNRTSMGNLSERGVISPVSDNAFFFYQYRLLGTLVHREGKSYKILATPKREYDPAFSGIVYIADSSYAIKEIDWLITNQQQIRVIDTLSVRQTYQRIEGSWLPIQTRIGFAVDFRIFGLTIPIQGFTQSILSDFQINPGFDPKFFGREILAVSDSAMEQDANFWDDARPIPLSDEEREDYSFKDSLEVVQNSPEYLDSLTAANRGIKPFDILITGYSFTNYRKKTTWQVESMLGTLGFNAMEGFWVAPAVSHTWDWEAEGSLKITGRVRYGFSNEQVNGQLGIEWVSNPARSTVWEISGGIYPREFSGFSQISSFDNASYALLLHRNFIRLYRSTSGYMKFGSEIWNGLTFTGELFYDRRRQMVNTTSYSLFRNDRTYVPNFSFPDHQAFTGTIKLRYQPFNRYIRVPGGKINLGSRWPGLELAYRQTLGGDGEGWVDYRTLQLTLDQELSLGLLGNTRWRVTAGTFLDRNQTYLQDLFHFKGNETISRSGSFDEFWLMPYYVLSTHNNYLEAHVEHSFGGFITNKIPLLRRLKLNEYLGFHALSLEGGTYYAEINFGLEKLIFKALPVRIDANVRISGEAVGDKWGWKFVAP